MRSTLQKVGVLTSVAVALVGVAACGSSSSTKSTSTPTAAASGSAAATTAAFTCPSGGINFGVEPYEDASKLTPAYKTVAAALGTALNCKINVEITESYAAEILAMQAGKLQMGEFGPLGYVFASNNADAQPVASFSLADGTLSTYTAGIWVPKGSAIKTVADLKGKTLALSSAGSTSGDAVPRYAILKAGLSASDVKTNYAGGHTQSLLALVNGKVDAAEVNSQTEATATTAGMFDASKYTEIFKSDPIPNDPITVYGKETPAFQAAIAKALLALPESAIDTVNTELAVTPPGPLKAVTKADYQQLFDLAATLHLTTKDL